MERNLWPVVSKIKIIIKTVEVNLRGKIHEKKNSLKNKPILDVRGMTHISIHFFFNDMRIKVTVTIGWPGPEAQRFNTDFKSIVASIVTVVLRTFHRIIRSKWPKIKLLSNGF